MDDDFKKQYKLQDRVDQFDSLREANYARDQVWDPEGKLDGSFKGNELGGETGEVQNKIKKLERERLGLKGSRTTVAELAEECADVVICVDLICMHYGIDLWEEIKSKFNKTSKENNLGVYL